MKIMVAYDGTDAARKALELALEHAKVFDDSKVYVLTTLVGGIKDQRKDWDRGEAHVEYATKLLTDANISHEVELITHGVSAGESFVEFARENDIDEIIMGIVKTSKVGKLVFGSTAQHVILESPCPVISIRA
jgi:nucleotide-binding universal stress UspA family protein